MWKNVRREGTSSVEFEVLIMNSEKDFIHWFIFNYLASNINLLIFNCLTLNINLFIFDCLTSNFCFPKNIYFASRREPLFVDARPYFQILNSLGKMMTSYIRDTNKFWGTAPCAGVYYNADSQQRISN